VRFDIPVVLDTVFCGKAGSSGSFVDPETKEVVDFADAFAFDFDSADGNVQRLQLRANRILEVAAKGFDIDKLHRYTDRVRIVGNAVVNTEGRSFFKPVSIGLVPAAS
jgi:hypothetical protein